MSWTAASLTTLPAVLDLGLNQDIWAVPVKTTAQRLLTSLYQSSEIFNDSTPSYVQLNVILCMMTSGETLAAAIREFN